MDGWDSGDLDAVESLTLQEGWEIYKKRLERTIEKLRDELERPGDHYNTGECRGKIYGLRLALNMPRVLVTEIREELERQEKD